MCSIGICKKMYLYIISAVLLWTVVFGLTVWGAEVPGGGKAVDGTIYNPEAAEVSKGSGIVNAPDMPGSPDQEKDSQNFNSPALTKAPHKSETTVSSGDVRVSGESSSASSGSPVLLCGGGKAASSTDEDKKEAFPGRGISLGTFVTTGYCSCEECSGGFGLTYSGTVPQARHTISADISLFPVGTLLMIDDIIYTVEDIGSDVIGNHIDIYYDNHEDAVAHGRQMQEVFTVE